MISQLRTTSSPPRTERTERKYVLVDCACKYITLTSNIKNVLSSKHDFRTQQAYIVLSACPLFITPSTAPFYAFYVRWSIFRRQGPLQKICRGADTHSRPQTASRSCIHLSRLNYFHYRLQWSATVILPQVQGRFFAFCFFCCFPGLLDAWQCAPQAEVKTVTVTVIGIFIRVVAPVRFSAWQLWVGISCSFSFRMRC